MTSTQQGNDLKYQAVPRRVFYLDTEGTTAMGQFTAANHPPTAAPRSPEAFPLEPQPVEHIETAHRRIVTDIPVPESLPIIESLRQHEPRSMGGQPPIVWDHAQGFQVYDAWGNCWIDWSSGVLVTSVGHADPDVLDAIRKQVDQKLIYNYCFPSEVRDKLTHKLTEVAPEGLDKVFLLTTGSEATECAIKLSRSYGLHRGGPEKITIVGFDDAFHGRTMGSQMAGGVTGQKQWIVNLDANMIQVPFPDGFRCPDQQFDLFEKTLADHGVKPEHVAGVMSETYPGGSARFMPVEYAQALRRWCDKYDVLLTMDEVQAGFGRCGRYWGFEHYGITPDLICCGKGISGGPPLSAVIGRGDVMDLHPPGSMTSTHGGNPIPAAAALANLQAIEKKNLVEHAAKMEQVLLPAVKAMQHRYPDRIGAVDGKGLVAALQIVHPGTTDPDPDTARGIVRRCFEQGVLMFAPVGVGGASVKISPPLCITEDALGESLGVLDDAVSFAMGRAAEQASKSEGGRA